MPATLQYAACSSPKDTHRCNARSRNAAPAASGSTAEVSSTVSGVADTTIPRWTTRSAGSRVRRRRRTPGLRARCTVGGTASTTSAGAPGRRPSQYAAAGPVTTLRAPPHSQAARTRVSAVTRCPATR
nr:hypothetical protein [Pseudonocardia sp. AL041005-10]